MPSGEDATIHTRATLPPPEWGPKRPEGDAPASSEDAKDADALPRRRERRAEEAALRFERERAASKGDGPAERAACIALARLLAAQERSLLDATQAAARALALGEDTELRSELAGWLEAMGRH